MKALTWTAANAVRKTGTPIRRDGWTKWLTKEKHCDLITFPEITSTGQAFERRVALNTDMTSREFAASDWTDEAGLNNVPPLYYPPTPTGQGPSPAIPPGVLITPVSMIQLAIGAVVSGTTNELLIPDGPSAACWTELPDTYQPFCVYRLSPEFPRAQIDRACFWLSETGRNLDVAVPFDGVITDTDGPVVEGVTQVNRQVQTVQPAGAYAPYAPMPPGWAGAYDGRWYPRSPAYPALPGFITARLDIRLLSGVRYSAFADFFLPGLC